MPLISTKPSSLNGRHVLSDELRNGYGNGRFGIEKPEFFLQDISVKSKNKTKVWGFFKRNVAQQSHVFTCVVILVFSKSS